MATELPDGIAVATIFAIEARYAPDPAETRPTHRAEHLARIAALRGRSMSGRRFSGRGLISTVALAAVLLAGCGTSGPATSLPSAGASGSAAPGSPAAGGSSAPGTLRPAGAYSLTLPTGWHAVQIGSNYATTAKAYDQTNLRFASSLMSQLAALPKTASAYAFDGSDATVRSGTLVALTVTEVALPATVNLDAFSAEIDRQAALLVEADVPIQRIQTASGPADQLVYVAPLNQTAAGTEAAAITQVLLVAPGRGYVLTFSTTPARAATDAPVFAQIASSIVLAP